MGTLSAKVRAELWAVAVASVGTRAAVLISPAANEQHNTIQTAGERRRTVEDLSPARARAIRAGGGEQSTCIPAVPGRHLAWSR
ncbi:type I-E CRISPR-associated endoribonuclease Cas2 [Streptacidiphilus sp. PAMC 29251]